MAAQIVLIILSLTAFNSALAQEMSLAEAQSAADSQEAALQASLADGTSAVSAPKAQVSTSAKPAPLYEASCKIKAKEAAAQIFRSCMTDGKNAQLEQIRKEYQQKLGAMRADYEKELNRLSKLKKESKAEAKEPKNEIKESQTDAKQEEIQPSESMSIKLKPDTKDTIQETAKETKPRSTKTTKAESKSKTKPTQKTAQKFTKKGLPLKMVKSTLTEMKNVKADDNTMTVSLKPAKTMEFHESQEIPEPVAIENFETKQEEKISEPNATIQLD